MPLPFDGACLPVACQVEQLERILAMPPFAYPPPIVIPYEDYAETPQEPDIPSGAGDGGEVDERGGKDSNGGEEEGVWT